MDVIPRHNDLSLLVKRPAAFAHRYRWALLLLLAGAVADAITTFVNVRRYGAGVEVHPAQRVVDELVGTTVGVPLAKVIQLAFVLFVAAWWRPWCKWVLTTCGVFYLLAAASNHFGWL